MLSCASGTYCAGSNFRPISLLISTDLKRKKEKQKTTYCTNIYFQAYIYTYISRPATTHERNAAKIIAPLRSPSRTLRSSRPPSPSERSRKLPLSVGTTKIPGRSRLRRKKNNYVQKYSHKRTTKIKTTKKNTHTHKMSSFQYIVSSVFCPPSPRGLVLDLEHRYLWRSSYGSNLRTEYFCFTNDSNHRYCCRERLLL